MADPVKVLCGLLAADERALEEALAALVDRWGGTDVRSPVFTFTYSHYYEREMGPNLLRQYVSFARLVDPGTLADLKREAAGVEARLRRDEGRGGRRVNLDPGYMTPASLVLATTKNFAQRVYLRDGIYAEVTLLFRQGRPYPLEWTYPDYRGAEAGAFLREARERLLAQQKAARADTRSTFP